MMLPKLCYFILAFAVNFLNGDRTPNCPIESHENVNKISFERPPPERVITCNHRLVEMYCCFKGFKTVYWEHYRNDSHTWEPVRVNRIKYYEDQNQTYVMNSPDIEYNKGLYRCTGVGFDGETINNVLDLKIEICVGYNKEPVFILPPAKEQHVSMNDNVTITCQVFYGPQFQKRSPLMEWTFKYKGESYICARTELSENCDPDLPERFQVNYRTEELNLVSYLHISKVEESDLTSFKCSVSDTKYQDQIWRSVQLRIRNVGTDSTSTIIAAVLGGLVGLIFVTFMVYWQFSLEIRLLVKEHKSAPPCLDKSYDAFVIHASDDSDDSRFVVETLTPILENRLHYSLCIEQRDFLARAVVDNYMEYQELSQCMIFVLSPAMLSNGWCEFIFQATVESEYRHMIFLTYKPIPSAIWDEHHRSLAAAVKVAKNKIVVPDSDGMDLRSTKGCLELSSKERKMDQFWKKLRLAMPLSLHSREREVAM